MTAEPEVVQALAQLEGWLDLRAGDLPPHDEFSAEFQRHVTLMQAEAERLRRQMEG